MQALLQSGLDPIPPIALGGELGALCYWRQNPGYIDEAIYAWPPGDEVELGMDVMIRTCLLYTSPSPRDLSTSRMPSSA